MASVFVTRNPSPAAGNVVCYEWKRRVETIQMSTENAVLFHHQVNDERGRNWLSYTGMLPKSPTKSAGITEPAIMIPLPAGSSTRALADLALSIRLLD